MLIGLLIIITFQFTIRVAIVVAGIFVDRFIIAVASESLNLLIGFILVFYFRLREPISVTLQLLPSGEFRIIRPRTEQPPKEDADVEMVKSIDRLL